jgi:hypothetical protein
VNIVEPKDGPQTQYINTRNDDESANVELVNDVEKLKNMKGPELKQQAKARDMLYLTFNRDSTISSLCKRLISYVSDPSLYSNYVKPNGVRKKRKKKVRLKGSQLAHRTPQTSSPNAQDRAVWKSERMRTQGEKKQEKKIEISPICFCRLLTFVDYLLTSD